MARERRARSLRTSSPIAGSSCGTILRCVGGPGRGGARRCARAARRRRGPGRRRAPVAVVAHDELARLALGPLAEVAVARAVVARGAHGHGRPVCSARLGVDEVEQARPFLLAGDMGRYPFLWWWEKRPPRRIPRAAEGAPSSKHGAGGLFQTSGGLLRRVLELDVLGAHVPPRRVLEAVHLGRSDELQRSCSRATAGDTHLARERR